MVLFLLSNVLFADEEEPVAADKERKMFAGTAFGALYWVNGIFEYSLIDKFSIVTEAGLNFEMGTGGNINVHGRFYPLEKMGRLYLSLGLGYYGDFQNVNYFTIDPHIGWRWNIPPRRSRFALEYHISYPSLVPIDGEWNLPYNHWYYSLMGAFYGFNLGVRF
jgi:hypothetical protein